MANAPNQDIKLGTAADKPKAQPDVPEADRYYYPPGTTEPQLKPEFADQAADTTKPTPPTDKPSEGR